MFEASAPFLFLDYFRIPYDVDLSTNGPGSTSPGTFLGDCGRLRLARKGEAPILYWPLEAAGALPVGSYFIESIPFHARLLPERVAAEQLATAEGRWTPETPIVDAWGRRVASVWREERGSVLLPFDPAEAMGAYWSESYRTTGGPSAAAGAKTLAMNAYYRVRPALPRATQIWMRRLFSRLQARSTFPRWPVETALHDLYGFLFRIVTGLAGEPVPWLAPWPRDYRWALVLTHDVETAVGYENVGLLAEVERSRGFRSSWNFVPRRYDVDSEVLEGMREEGFEIGVHGLYHDGRDVESLAVLQERLPAIRNYAERWGAVGFRSPATHRAWDLMPLLGFDYDSSYPDTDPFEPKSGGCCSWLPFFNGGLVELPITLPQDHTLFVILQRDESLWLEKTAFLRERGGMALLITHPDYMLDQARLDAYGRLLEKYAEDQTLWRALPHEVSAWWRRRAASRIASSGSGWAVIGPAAGEARVELAVD